MQEYYNIHKKSSLVSSTIDTKQSTMRGTFGQNKKSTIYTAPPPVNYSPDMNHSYASNLKRLEDSRPFIIPDKIANQNEKNTLKS